VDFRRFAAKPIDAGRHEIDDRPRTAGAVSLGDVIELNRDRHQRAARGVRALTTVR
jgi:hypothetical protein